MKKFSSLLGLILLVISFVFFIFVFQSKKLIAHGQAEDDCRCATEFYFNESTSLCIRGTLFCDDTADTVCGCDSKNYLNSCVAHANGIKTFTKDSCSTTTMLAICIIQV